ncbi:MAG: tripartite tricarboxylate transporter TctB family protein [Chitinophagales bacterium]
MATKVGGFILLLLGLGTTYLGLQYGFGGLHAPGPGFFPVIVGAFLAILACIYLLQEFRGGGTAVSAQWVRPLAVIVLSFVYVALLEKLGFLIDTVLMLLVFVGVIERQRLRRTLGVALLGTAGMYVVFALWLRVPLPKGPLPF